MLEDMLILILPNYKKPGWKQAQWTRLILILLIFIPIAGLINLLFRINWQQPLEQYNTEGIFWVSTIFLVPLIGRISLWHIVIKKIATQSSRPQRPKKTGASTPAHQLSPAQLENEIGWMLETLGKENRVELTGKAGDQGIDIKIYNNEGMLRTIVQVKRLSPNAYCKPAHLRDLDSCRRRLGVSNALLATTGKFSSETRRHAQEWDIHLWDGTAIEEQRKKAYAKTETPKQ